jgi:serine/threonine protein kinase
MGDVKEGWLSKQGGGLMKTWNKRWFRLQGKTFSYYEKPGKKEQGQIELAEASEVSAAPDCKRQPAFKVVVPSLRTYYLQADNKADCDSWIATLSKVISTSKPAASSSPAASAPGAAKPGAAAADKPHVNADSFEILKVLGRGTYGKVQLVRSKIDGQLYAMKTMVKKMLEENEQVEQTLIEKDVLLKTRHPFLVSAHASFQTPKKIYLVIDYVPAGELFGRLKEEGKFSEARARLYAAEIALGLGALHAVGFVYRDLKPENVLVDGQGHLKLTDFGLVKTQMNGSDATTTTFCGTPEYIAPEMLQQKPYTKAVDWWSFGILVFEMLTGLPPFYHENTNKMYRMILQDPITYPSYLSKVSKDFIGALLNRDPAARLGGGSGGVEDVKGHPFFSSLKWDDVMGKKIKPEWVPKMASADDTHLFDQEFTQEAAIDSYADDAVLDQDTQAQFQGFTCVQDSEI